MIHEYNADRTGYAAFSDDGIMRYHLMRMVTPRAKNYGAPMEFQSGGLTMAESGVRPREWLGLNGVAAAFRIAVFLLLNPSTADAFKPDPTVTTCGKFTLAWGDFDILWVVNLNAYRSSHPRDLKRRATGFRGDDHPNNRAILTACRCAAIVIAGWGREGSLGGRDQFVKNMLRLDSINLHHLGLTQEGFPKHPAARGVHRIPADQQPVPWTP